MDNYYEMSAATNTATCQYATFYLDGEFFGIDVMRVQEILRQQSMTPIPLAPEYICGLINLRGQIVTAMDLGKKLTNRPGECKTDGMNIVVATQENSLSLVVDEIGDVLDIDDEAIEPVPATLNKIKAKFLKGVYKLNNDLLLLLDVHNIVEDVDIRIGAA